MKKQVRRLVVLALVVGMLATSVLGTSAAFDPVYYAAQNPDVVKALGNSPAMLKLHYDMFGRKEARMSNKNDVEAQLRKLFDEKEYAKLYPDVKKAFGDDKEAMFNHYVAFGLLEGRRPSEKVSQATASSLKKTVEKAMKDAGLAATPGSPEVVAAITGETSSVASAGAAVQQTVAKVADVVAKEVTATVEKAQSPAPSSSSSSGSSSGGSSTPTQKPAPDAPLMDRARYAVDTSMNDLDLSGDNLTETQAEATVTGNAVTALATDYSDVKVEWKKTSYKKADGETNGELKGTLMLYRYVGSDVEKRYVPVSKVIYSDINWEFKVATKVINDKIDVWEKDTTTAVTTTNVQTSSSYALTNTSATHVEITVNIKDTPPTTGGANGTITAEYTLKYVDSVEKARTSFTRTIPIKSAATIILAKAKQAVQTELDKYTSNDATKVKALRAKGISSNDELLTEIKNTKVSGNDTVSDNKIELAWKGGKPRVDVSKDEDSGKDGALEGTLVLSKGSGDKVEVEVDVVFITAASVSMNDAAAMIEGHDVSDNAATDDKYTCTISGNDSVSGNAVEASNNRQSVLIAALNLIKKLIGWEDNTDVEVKWSGTPTVDVSGQNGAPAGKAQVSGDVELGFKNTKYSQAKKVTVNTKVTVSGNTYTP